MFRQLRNASTLQKILADHKNLTLKPEVGLISLGSAQLQQKLKGSFLTDPLNSVSSLSQINEILTKQQSFQLTRDENKNLEGIRLAAKQYYKFFLMFLRFLKTGIHNVWLNKKALNQCLTKEYYIDTIDDKVGSSADRKIKINNSLTQELYSFLKNRQTEDKKPPVFQITRSMYQTFLRSNRDFMKLPVFGVTVFIFEDLTPLICYLFPDITPSTCLLPQLFNRSFSKAESAQRELKTMVEKRLVEESAENIAMKSVHSLSGKAVQLLCDLLQLKPQIVPAKWYPLGLLKSRLEKRYKEIAVDDCLILQSGGIWNMCDLEVFDACIQRGLLNFSNLKDMRPTVERNTYQQIDFQRLRLALLKSMAEFSEANNAGVLLVQTYLTKEVEALSREEIEDLVETMAHD